MKHVDTKKMEKLREYSGYPAQATIPAPSYSSEEHMNKTVLQLQKAASKFALMPIEQRIKLAESIQKGYVDVAERSVQAGCKAKGIELGSPAEAEEWATGPWGIVRQLRLICESLRSIQTTGDVL